MAETATALAAGGDIAKIVRESGSTINYSPLPISKNIFPNDIASQLDSMAVGQMKAPYYYAGDNTMNIIKVINKISAPDSIQLRQIQVAGADMNAIQKTADIAQRCGFRFHRQEIQPDRREDMDYFT